MPSRPAMFAAAGIAVIACSSVAASGLAAGTKKRAYTQHLVGAQVAAGGGTVTDAYKVTDSINGPGAAIQKSKVTGTSLPAPGTDTVTVYYGNGTAKTKDTFTLGAPDANGISTISGKGSCTEGTGAYKGQKCTYTFTGTYNTNTTQVDVKVKGTVTK